MKHPKQYDTTPAVSRRMARVRLKRGEAETMLAKALWRRGYRYRLNHKALPGSPDIALTKHKIAIFVDGEFWHGYNWLYKKKVKSNPDYWREKIQENMARDIRDGQRLAAMNWTVLRFWEREVKRDLDKCVQAVEAAVFEGMLQRHEERCGQLSGDSPDQ